MHKIWLKLRAWLTRVRVVEVDLARPRVDAEGREALASLQNHPGITYLLARLRLQRWYLENLLRTNPLETVRDLQVGIRWIAWMERQIEDATNQSQRDKNAPSPEELESFAKAQAAIEFVGQ